MTNFEKHSAKFLGIESEKFNTGSRVFFKELKYDAFPGHFYWYMIITEFQGERIICIHPEFAKKFDTKELRGLLLMSRIEAKDYLDAKFIEKKRGFYVQIMDRYSITPDEFEPPDNPRPVELLTPRHKKQFLSKFHKCDSDTQNEIWNNRLPMIKLNHSFISCSENEYFSIGNVSYVIENCANLGVSTNEKYRKMGYGKSVVAELVKWCFQKNHTPFYFVSVNNLPSIALAKSLGFSLKAEEVVVRSEIFV